MQGNSKSSLSSPKNLAARLANSRKSRAGLLPARKSLRQIVLSLVSFILGSAVITATVYAETNTEVTVSLKMLSEKPNNQYIYPINTAYGKH